MESITTLATLFFVAFSMHVVWEKLHIGLYTGYERLGKGTRLTVFASLGDGMYTLLAVSLVGLIKADMLWFVTPTTQDYVALAVLGAVLAVGVEYKAFALKRWGYTRYMPTVARVGVSPVAQMALLLPLSVYVTKQLVQIAVGT